MQKDPSGGPQKRAFLGPDARLNRGAYPKTGVFGATWENWAEQLHSCAVGGSPKAVGDDLLAQFSHVALKVVPTFRGR